MKSFVSRLLGRGDMAGLVQMFESNTSLEESKETVEKIMQGEFVSNHGGTVRKFDVDGSNRPGLLLLFHFT